MSQQAELRLEEYIILRMNSSTERSITVRSTVSYMAVFGSGLVKYI